MRRMLQILSPSGEVKDKELLLSLGFRPEDYIKIYRLMVLTRLMHLEGERRAHLNHMTIFIGPMGQEAAEIGSALALSDNEWAFLYGRSWGAALARGVSPKSIYDGFFGNPDPEAINDFYRHFTYLPYVSVGVHLPHAAGKAFAEKLLEISEKEKKNIPTIAYFGDGATAEGFFHSAMNWASVFNLPVVFFCENNRYAISTKTDLQTATETFADRALGYNMASELVDGNDPLAVYCATRRALETARIQGRPTFIEALTYRLCDHTTAVGKICEIPKEEIETAKLNDPLRRMQLFLLSPEAKIFGDGWPAGLKKAEDDIPDDILYKETNVKANCADRPIFAGCYEEAKNAAKKSYQEFLAACERGAELVKTTENWHRAPKVGKRYQNKDLAGISFKSFKNAGARQAINAAVYDAMRFDPAVVWLGQDVAKIGGVMRTTAIHKDYAGEERFIKERLPDWPNRVLKEYLPLVELFPNQIFDTPLDESGIIGVGLGMSLGGMRPIMEMQFSGFAKIGMDQIEEFARFTHRNINLLNLPGVVFLPFGGGERIEYHRDCEIPIFMNNPGLIIVCPSAVQDFYDMLWASIASDKPVLFFAHIDLYREPKTEVLKRRPPLKPIEEFGIIKAAEGKNITVVSYGRMVQECQKAIALVNKQEENFSADLLDMRVIHPLKKDIIVDSVAKTGRLVVVQEEPPYGGVGAEVARIVAGETKVFERLSAPIKVVSAPPTHFPPSKFWRYYIPQPENIASAILETLKFK